MINVQDPRITKTLKSIQNGFAECINEKTFTSVTVKDIITTANINRSTFYKYYEDKYDLRKSLVKSTLDELADDINLDCFKLDADSISKLEKQLDFMYSHKNWYLTLWNKNMELYIYDNMLQVFENKIRECLSLNSSFDDSDETYLNKLELFISLFASSALTTVKWWYNSSTNMSANNVARIIIDNIKFGMQHAFSLSNKL